jgi:UDP-N-acetylmuramate--alanine ligase
MHINELHSVYLVGIGGIGMSALARFFKRKGVFVAGYDRTPTPLCSEMQNEGIEIHFTDDVALIAAQFRATPKQNALVIYTPAIPVLHRELTWLRSEGFSVLKRSEVLGIISRNFKTIAVGGTHGKTTTSAMIAHILQQSDLGCNAFLGGISTNYNTNLLTSEHSNYAVIEADEFDRSFLTLSPHIAVITSVDADHLDIYGEVEAVLQSFNDFAAFVQPDGVLIRNAGIKGLTTNSRELSYSIRQSADLQGVNIRIEQGAYWFDVKSNSKQIQNIKLGLPGRHNVENAVAAVGVALQLSVKEEIIKQALASFKGVKRRFETHILSHELIYIDDYAHHPTEIAACIGSVKELYPNKKITGIFQPHLYSRTRDFAKDFALSLSELDEVILLDIYPAREEAIPGIDSLMLLNLIQSSNKRLMSKEQLVHEMSIRKPQVLLTMGAGDIDQLVEPIIKALAV